MPNFPSINTLTQKPTLTGDEVIQISATERTTLSKILEQLGFSPSSVLTGLTATDAGNLDNPAATDTLIQAISKLVAMVGGDKLTILPIPVDGEYYIGPSFVIYTDNSAVSGGTGGVVAVVEMINYNTAPRITVRYRTWSNASEHPLLTCDTIFELAYWVNNNNPACLYNWGEAFIENSSNDLIEFNPGDVIFHTGTAIARIRIPIYYWNNINAMFHQNSSIIITKVNVLRSMFNEGSGGTFANIVYLFSEDFDDAPGTEYQCITIQKVRVSGGKAYLMVNKGGYISGNE